MCSNCDWTQSGLHVGQHKILDWSLSYWSLNDEYDHLNLKSRSFKS